MSHPERGRAEGGAGAPFMGMRPRSEPGARMNSVGSISVGPLTPLGAPHWGSAAGRIGAGRLRDAAGICIILNGGGLK